MASTTSTSSSWSPSGAAVVRTKSFMHLSIEQKRDTLYYRQAGDYMAWILEFLELKPTESTLMSALKSGVILCQLVKAIDPSIADRVDGFRMPKKQMTVFNAIQAIENIQHFLHACRYLKIPDVDLFQPNDLVQEANRLKVLRTLQCLRRLVEDRTSSSNAAQPAAATATAATAATATGMKEVPPAAKKEGPADDNRPFEPLPEMSTPSQAKVEAADADATKKHVRAVMVRRRTQKLFKDPKTGNISEVEPGANSLATLRVATSANIILNPPNILEEATTPRELASPKKPQPEPVPEESDDSGDDDDEKGFVEPMNVDIMARLLSKSASRDGEDDEDDDDDNEATVEDDFHRLSVASNDIIDKAISDYLKQEEQVDPYELIDRLKREIWELKEILRTEVVLHIKEKDSIQQQNQRIIRERDEALGDLRKAQKLINELKEANLKLVVQVKLTDGEAELHRSKSVTVTEPETKVPTSVDQVVDAKQKDKVPSVATQAAIASVDPMVRATQLWSHQEDVIPILPTIEETERVRQQTIFEFMNTEEGFVADLNLIIQTFLIPMKKFVDSRTFTEKQHRLIFRNIEELFRVSGSFLKDLQKLKQEQWPVIRTFSGVVLKHTKGMAAFSIYCGGQDQAVEEILRAETENSNFENHLKECLSSPVCRQLGLHAFLLLPMQRLTKYPLLLSNILKCTPLLHEDYENTQRAFEAMNAVTQEADHYQLHCQNVVRAAKVEKRLDWAKLGKRYEIKFSEGDRENFVVREGYLTRLRLKKKKLVGKASKHERLYCFLFSECFLFTKVTADPDNANAEPRYTAQIEPLKHSEISVRNIPDDENGFGAKNVLLVSCKRAGTIVLQAASNEEKRQWITDFRKYDLVIDSLLNVHDEAISGPMAESAFPATPLSNVGSSEDVSSLKAPSILQENMGPAPSISVGDLMHPDCEFDGWLRLHTPKSIPPWKQRYFVLKDFCLYYFRSDRLDEKAMGMIMLPSYRIAPMRDSKKCVFRADHPSRLTKPAIFMADSPEQMELWIEAMTHATMARATRRHFWL